MVSRIMIIRTTHFQSCPCHREFSMGITTLTLDDNIRGQTINSVNMTQWSVMTRFDINLLNLIIFCPLV